MNSLDITIFQGASWEDAKFYYPEDLSAGTAKGQIRSDYLGRGGVLHGEFGFYPLAYGAIVLPNTAVAVNRTIIAPKISGIVTANVPLGKVPWVYDIFVQLGSRSIKVASGAVMVIPRVTEA